MRMNFIATVALAGGLSIVAAGCTGGQETAAETVASNQTSATRAIDPAKELGAISATIPLYEGANFRNDLTERDAALMRNRYGQSSSVYTLVTDDSFPKVWHYYVTYLAQFRGYEPLSPYPPENRAARTMEVKLNQAMQDPFIPGDTLPLTGKQVTLQIVESDRADETLIRYIVSDAVAEPQLEIATTTTSGTAVAAAGAVAGPGESAEDPAEPAEQ